MFLVSLVLLGSATPLLANDARFRAIDLYASTAGFGSGFPTYNEAVYDGVKVYGVILVKKEAVEFKNVPVSELGSFEDSVQGRIQALDRWASKNGFATAIPTFHKASYDGGKTWVVGCYCVKKEATDFRDVSEDELGKPDSVEKLFRAVDGYATNNLPKGTKAFPTTNTASPGGKTHYGVHFIKPEFCEHRDLADGYLSRLVIANQMKASYANEVKPQLPEEKRAPFQKSLDEAFSDWALGIDPGAGNKLNKLDSDGNDVWEEVWKKFEKKVADKVSEWLEGGVDRFDAWLDKKAGVILEKKAAQFDEWARKESDNFIPSVRDAGAKLSDTWKKYVP